MQRATLNVRKMQLKTVFALIQQLGQRDAISAAIVRCYQPAGRLLGQQRHFNRSEARNAADFYLVQGDTDGHKTALYVMEKSRL